MRSRRIVCLATPLVAITLAACQRDHSVFGEEATASDPAQIEQVAGNGHEGELYGSILANGTRSQAIEGAYVIKLIPDAATQSAIDAELGSRWDPLFIIANNTSGGARSWEWFDEWGDGECTPGGTFAELHGGEGLERHCIVPGRYTLQVLNADDVVLRSIPVDYMGGKRYKQYALSAHIPNATAPIQFWSLANQAFDHGLLGTFGGTLVPRYRAGDLQYDFETVAPQSATEPTPQIVIENVAGTPNDTLYVPLSTMTVGPQDQIRIDASGSPATAPYLTANRLVRIWLSDGAGTRPISRYFGAWDGWEHLRTFSIASTSGCPQFGVETLQPYEAPSSQPSGQVAWRKLAVTGRCSTPQLPDLTASLQSVPASWPTLTDATIQFTVTNTGTLPTDASAGWRAFLSPDASLDLDDRQVGEGTIPALAAGGSATLTSTFQVPVDVVTAYDLIVQVDPDRSIEESVEANNVVASASRPVIALADLRIASPISLTAALGTTATLAYTDQNLGGQAANAPWIDRFYISADQTLQVASDTLLGSSVVSQGLSSGGAASSQALLKIPPTFGVGTRPLLALTDADDQVVESVEGNNVTSGGTVTITYAPGKDLAATQLRATQSGSILTDFYFEFRNIGTDRISCTSLYYRFYLSADTMISSDDPKTFYRLALPCPSTSGALSSTTVGGSLTSFWLPFFRPAPSGTYHLIAKIDSEESVTESNEDNNTIVADGLVVVP